MTAYKLELEDYFAILKRRTWAFLVPTLLIVAIAVPIILVLPPSYRSSATILIEDQAIPRDMVRSTVNTYAAERLEVITQRVTATQNLVDLINKTGLYRDRRDREPMSELAARVRKSFRMRLIEASVTTEQGGAGKATIAFTLAFEDGSAEKAQAVVNELVTLYISENLRTRRQKAEETSKFLEQELLRVTEQISTLELSLVRFKEANAGNLPDQIKVTMSALDRAEQQLLLVRRQMEVLRERKIYLEAQLVQIDPYLRTGDGTKLDDLSPEERLRRLRSQLTQLRARYGGNHPEILRTVRQIEMLAKEVPSEDGTPDADSGRRDLAAAKRELSEARQKYADAHPEVVRLRKRVALLEQSARDAGPQKTKSEPKAGQHNPAYIKLKADLAAADVEMKSLTVQEKELRQQIAVLERQTIKAPQVEQEYVQLQRTLEAALASQRDLTTKLRQARLGESLEIERKSERFSLLEPASLAKEPTSPNRPAFILVACVFALGLGAASVAGFEAKDKSIHNPRHLAALTGMAPLLVLPNIVDRTKLSRRRTKRILVLGTLLAVLVAGLGLVVFAEVFGPWEVILSKVETKIEIWLRNIGIF